MSTFFGYRNKNHMNNEYRNPAFAMRTVSHSSKIPVPDPALVFEESSIDSDNKVQGETSRADDNANYRLGENHLLNLISQIDFIELVQHSALPKDSTDLL